MSRMKRARMAVAAAAKAQGRVVELTQQAIDEAMTSPEPEGEVSLDFSSPADIQTVMQSVLRGNGGRVGEDDLLRQTQVVCEWIQQVQCDAALAELILRGSADVRVDSAGEMFFTQSKPAARRARPN